VSAVHVSLTGASWLDGAACTDAELRPLDEREVLALLGLEAEPPARATTALLARSLERLGAAGSVGDREVRGLTLGDREALMLELRRLEIGERIECSAPCGCGELLEVAVDAGGLRLASYSSTAEWHERELGGRRVRFRLPTGGDQEAAIELALVDEDAAADLVLRSCVAEVDGEPPVELPAAVAAALPDAMAELDPQAELELAAACPECGGELAVPLDAQSLVVDELGRRAAELLAEIHALASVYHWSEADILALGPGRRRRYLDLLDDARSEAAWATSY
jgi:hypothetical protein